MMQRGIIGGAGVILAAATMGIWGSAAMAQSCGDANAGDCNVANGTPACSDADCCNTVCAIDPFCCDTEWDDLCADAAAANCGGGGGGGCPGTGDCFSPNGSPGCDDAECCATVCALDPFCCNTEWDDLCAEAAVANCGGGGGSCFPSCGKQNVECLAGTPEYNNRTIVGQLADSSGPFCTAWIIAEPNIVMTNEHCVGSSVNGLEVRFNVECDTCEDGTTKTADVYQVVELIHVNAALDYAILRLEGNPAATWGVATVDDTQPTVGQEIYEIHHGEGRVKGYDSGQVTSIDIPGTCIPGTLAEFGVNAIATGGASGSPIFDATTHCVVGICHCGPPCSPGWGIPMSAIMPDALPHIEAAGGKVIGCFAPPTCPGDATGDGSIDFDDLNAVLAGWGGSGSGDVDNDGDVDFDDLNLVLAHWGEDCLS